MTLRLFQLSVTWIRYPPRIRPECRNNGLTLRLFQLSVTRIRYPPLNGARMTK
ncbi:hypothetical protein PU629_17545 [Pullulanibacillus sp. KACC 23026]|uniref:hypothetical protein n=1 Tax=Pullulanibacillus sp. KACC 23026 TaxID=3028315 RepID=UPI0023B04BDF|nr:hypothetical protein [Pullulanibacillus sp. KACC 23026]WEG11911.1 hypothetical protein PU629_17545 [Pullulanibacillus sp. KACC 23026]